MSRPGSPKKTFEDSRPVSGIGKFDKVWSSSSRPTSGNRKQRPISGNQKQNYDVND